MRKQLSLAVLFVALSCSVIFGQQSGPVFPIIGGTGGLTNYTIPSINTRLTATLWGITTTNDGFGGTFIYNTNDTTAVNPTNVFAPGTGQGGRWTRLLIPGAGGSAPFGAVGGVDVTGTLPNNLTVVKINGATLGVTTATSGNILIATNSTWTSTPVTGDWTISNGGVATLANVVSAGTGTKITANAKGLVTTIANAVLASSDFANQGSATNVLHGGATPSWGPVTSADITNTTFVTSVTATLPLTSSAGLTPNISSSMATGSLIGRNTAGTGVFEVITDIPTAVTIGGAYVYRVGGTDVSVADGGTGGSTFTKGIVVSPGGTTALTTVAGTDGYFPYWSSSYPTTTSLLKQDTANSVTLLGTNLASFTIAGNGFNQTADSYKLQFGGTATSIAGTLDDAGAGKQSLNFSTWYAGPGGTMSFTGPGNLIVGASAASDISGTGGLRTTGRAVFGGGVYVGSGTTDPGANNLTVSGLTTTATLYATSTSTFDGAITGSYATASTAAVWNSSKQLVSSTTTAAQISYLSTATSDIQVQITGRVSKPIYGTGDPNADATVGLDGQMYMNTVNGNRWFNVAGGTSWQP